MNQAQKILEHMKIAPITCLQAINYLGCTRLSGRIFELREAGYKIDDRMKKVRNRRGEAVWVKEYRLAEPRAAKAKL